MVGEATRGATNPNCPRFKGDKLPLVSEATPSDGRKAGGLCRRSAVGRLRSGREAALTLPPANRHTSATRSGAAEPVLVERSRSPVSTPPTMHPSAPLRAALFAALALFAPALLAGCDSTGGPTETDADVVSSEEAAVAVAGALSSDGGGAFDAVAAAVEVPAVGRGATPEPGCTFTRAFDEGTVTWTRTVACERSTPGGRYSARFGRTQTFRFLVGGVAQPDPATAEALEFAIVDGYGEHTTPVLHHLLLDVGARLNVSGLQADTAVVAGTYDRSATDTLTVRRPGTDRSAQRTLIYDLGLAFDDVEVVSGADGRRGRPVGGSITGTIEGTATFTGPDGQTRTRDFSRTFTVTFDGRTPDSGLIDVAGARYHFNVQTGDVTGE